MIGEVVVTMILRCCLFRKDTPFQLFTFVKKNFHMAVLHADGRFTKRTFYKAVLFFLTIFYLRNYV